MDPPDVALPSRKGCGQERLDNLRCFSGAVHPGADPDDLSIIVLPGELSCLGAPRQRGPAPPYFVRRDLLPVSRSSDHHSQTAGIGDHPARGFDAERGVIIVGIEHLWTDVDHLVPEAGQVLDQKRLKLETSVVATEIDTHGVQQCHTMRLVRTPPCWESRG